MGGTFQNVLTPIERRPRNFNQLADELANYSMDLETNIEWECNVGGSWRNRDIVVFSDGGLRCKRGKASAAWIVLEKPRCNPISACPISASGVVGVAYILAKGAIFFPDQCHSSFMAEALAL